MQINGIGSGHSSSAHQVTECMHDHSVSAKIGGAAASSSGNNVVQPQTSSVAQQEGQFSLASWLKNTLSDGRKLLQKIWGESSVADSSGDNSLQTTEQVMAQIGDPEEGESVTGRTITGNSAVQETIAGSALRQQDLQNNPYFSAIEDTGRTKQNLWEKVRVRFHSVAGQLTKHFSGRNTFQAKQEKPKEDLRKHSRYREDDLEIDCILTDDSYLMDSYDRKGEYSKLSTKK